MQIHERSGVVDLVRRRPEAAYVDRNLWLPKARVPKPIIEKALTFPSDDPEVPLRLWKETPHHFVVPREFIPRGDYGRYKFPFYQAVSTEFERVRFECNIGPHPKFPHHQEAYEATKRARSGILEMGCGKGKTPTSIRAACAVGAPWMIVLDQKGLMSQWKREIERFVKFDGEIGWIQGDTFDWDKPIVIASIHTLFRRVRENRIPPGFGRKYGVVIYDEADILSAPMFSLTADVGSGRRWGLTATVKREDGLESIFLYHLGRAFYTNVGYDLKPVVYFQETNVRLRGSTDEKLTKDCNGSTSTGKLRGWIGRHPERNDLIASSIKEAVGAGRRVLGISHSRDQLFELKKRIPEAGVVVQEVKGEERLRIFGQSQVVLSTLKIGMRGLDSSTLDTLFVLTPFGNDTALAQTMGRILRPDEGKKQPLIIVFVDQNIEHCKKMIRELKENLKIRQIPFETINYNPA